MYTILLVDDEKSIRDLLPKVIPFKEHGFTVAATAVNGQEALAVLPKVQPDLILLDIRMPIMDGLAFLKELRASAYKDTQVVMLSGYSDFTYAKEAMRYGVKAYLNKPIDEEELYPILADVALLLDRQQGDTHRARMMRLNDLLRSALNDIPVPKAPFEGCTLLTLLLFPSSHGASEEHPLNVMKQVIHDFFHDEGTGLCMTRGCVSGYLVTPRMLDLWQGDSRAMIRDLHNALTQKGLDCALLYDTDSFAQAPDPITKRHFYKHESEMIADVFYSEKRTVFYTEEYEAQQAEMCFYKPEIDQLTQALLNGETQTALKTFAAICEDMYKTRRSLHNLNDLNNRLSIIISDALTAAEANAEAMGSFMLPNWLELAYFTTFTSWQSNVKTMLENTCNYTRQQQALRRLGIGGEVLQYVRIHYREPLSLKQVAEMFFMNPSYLGKVFQNAAGISFKQYITALRMQEAKKLLVQTDKRIYEIANAVGYPESKYFIVKFEEQEGVSPSEYRKRL